MRVISRKPLHELFQRYPEAKAELEAWFHEVEAAHWATPAQIKAHYGNASILKGSRVVFNICGNKYRLVVIIIPTRSCMSALPERTGNTTGPMRRRSDESESD